MKIIRLSSFLFDQLTHILIEKPMEAPFLLKLISSKENAFIGSLKLSPFFIGSKVFIVVLSFLFKTPLGKNLCIKTPDALIMAFIIAFFSGLAGMKLLK